MIERTGGTSPEDCSATSSFEATHRGRDTILADRPCGPPFYDRIWHHSPVPSANHGHPAQHVPHAGLDADHVHSGRSRGQIEAERMAAPCQRGRVLHRDEAAEYV